MLQDGPLILTHHNDLRANNLRGFLFACYTKFTLHTIVSLARKIIVVSLDHTRSGCLLDILARYPERFVQIPNGVDLSQFNLSIDGSSIPQSLHLESKAFLILFVGEMDLAHHYRRVDNLLRAVKLIRDPLVHLLLVGGGGNVPAYQKLAGQLGLDDQVHFFGRIEHRDLAEYYACADVFVLPSSIQEAFPLVVLEAMACGLPVVASDLPGVRTLVTKEVGFLVKPGDVEELAERIIWIRDNPGESKQMGERGHAIVSKTYSWTAIGKQLIDLYQQVIH
jgi:glycosyltransferase involved in cell wall biosynthesis